MTGRTFTPLQWAKVAGISLAKAELFARDLVELGLAVEHAGRFALTPSGEAVVQAVAGLPFYLIDDASEAAGPRSRFGWAVEALAPEEEAVA